MSSPETVPFRLVSPETLFQNNLNLVLDMMANRSPFPQAQTEAFRKSAKLRAARIHLDETVFFGQVAYHDLQPQRTMEVCAGFGLPSTTMGALFGVPGVCVDLDSERMAVGATIGEKLGIKLQWVKADLFDYLRKNADNLGGATLLTTAAYCRDAARGKPAGTGERDIVEFAKSHHLDLALLPFRTGDVLTKGFSSEKKRVEEYEMILKEAGYQVKRHSTRALFEAQGAPEWFFLDILTAKGRF